MRTGAVRLIIPLVVSITSAGASQDAAQVAATATPLVYPRALRETVKATDRMEAFLDGSGSFAWNKLPGALAEAVAQADAHLAANPDDVGAMVLRVRLGRIENILRPTTIGSQEGGGLGWDTVDHYEPLHAMLDRAVALQPTVAEAFYWMARLHGLERLRIEDGEPVLRSRWDLAVSPAEQAVALAPQEDRYRIVLGMSLAETGDVERAREVLRTAEHGRNVLYLILEDFARIPIPKHAIRHQRMEGAAAEMFAGAPGGLSQYGPQRVRVYVVSGTMVELEPFFRAEWPDFRLLPSKEGDSTTFAQFLRPKGDGLVPSKSLDALEGNRTPPTGIMVWVRQRGEVSEEERPYYPADVASGQFCELMLIDYRD